VSSQSQYNDGDHADEAPSRVGKGNGSPMVGDYIFCKCIVLLPTPDHLLYFSFIQISVKISQIKIQIFFVPQP
jgi:hypothetical protein